MSKKKEHKEDTLEEEISFIKPKHNIRVIGKISYKEELQAWGLIQLKKEILSMFPELKEKRSKFGYAMLYNRSISELKELLDQLGEKELVPILLLIGRVKG